MEHKQTRKLEKMICDFTGAKYCCMVPNGTLSLSAALLAYDCKPGWEIIIPDYTVIATATSASFVGAKPILCDVERETACLDYNYLKKLVNGNVWAVMLVSINGRMPKNFDAIKELCARNDLTLIEDSAQSLGSLYKGQQIGTFGDIGSFSFSISKVITMGSGGAVITNNKQAYEKLCLMKNFGRLKGGIDKNIYPGIDLKYNDVLATIGIEQMKKLPRRIKRRKEMYALYHSLLSDKVEFLETDLSQTSPWMVDIYLKNEKEKNKVINHLNKKDINTRLFYPAIHTQKLFCSEGEFPNSVDISNRGLWLPSSHKLTNEDITYICREIIVGLK